MNPVYRIDWFREDQAFLRSYDSALRPSPSTTIFRQQYISLSPSSWMSLVQLRVGNFRQKNYSAEDGIYGTIGLFRRNSDCSAEQKILGIPFRTIPQRRKMLGILYHGTKLEANPRNSVLNHSAEEKTTRNSVPMRLPPPGVGVASVGPVGWHTHGGYSRFSVPKHVSEENMVSILFAGPGIFVKLIFSCHILPFLASE